jgi:hypothetical protein
MHLNRLYTWALSRNFEKKNLFSLWFTLQSVLSSGQSTVNNYTDNNPITFNTDLQLYEKLPLHKHSVLRQKTKQLKATTT